MNGLSCHTLADISFPLWQKECGLQTVKSLLSPSPHPCLTTVLLLFETDFLTRSYIGHHILDTWTRSYIGRWECSSLVLTHRTWICKYEKCQGCYSCNNSLQFSAVIGETYPGFTSSPLGSPLCILPCFEDTFGDKFRTGTFLALTVLVTFLEWTAEQ